MLDTTSLVQRVLCWPGKVVSWLIIPLVLSIILTVLSARQGWSVLLEWETRIPVIGKALTVNSLVDAQWYIFALIVLFGGVWAYFEDRHVTVDFLAVSFSPRRRAYISIFGNLVFLLPLCVLILWFGSKFAMTSFTTGEGSIQGGLEAHWLIKGALPASFFLLGMAALVSTIGQIRALMRNEFQTPDVHHDS
jgi:TRAP-type mannitol/chloroaromatic compound transport system permease small subunit